MTDVLSADLGRNGMKGFTGTKMFWYPSIVGEWNERKLKTNYGENGFEVEVNGIKKFVGDLAQNESDNWRYMMTDNKATEDARFLALSAVHISGLNDVVLVTGLPVEQHDDAHKMALRSLLMGDRCGVWNVTLNGISKVIRIQDVLVAVEGGAAFWSAPQEGLVRLIDAGSKTVNYVTMQDCQYIYRDSGTLPFGFNTKRREKELNISEFVAQLAGELGAIKWTADDKVMIAGGRAHELANHLRTYFPKAESLPNPLFANAIGYYKAGRAVL